VSAESATGTEELLERYRAIHAHAESELEFAGRADLDALIELNARWDELIAGLPARPPAAAAALIERAQLMHERTRIELIRLREAMHVEIATTGRTRRAADGYGGQVRRSPLTDISA
jgi:hypothetical protein